MTRILFLSGSIRQSSFNRKLAASAATLGQAMGIDCDLVDLADFPLPIYHGDLESNSGLPENVALLKDRFVAADGVFFASPEYNGSFSPLLKNTIDWLSRRGNPDEPSLLAFRDKVAGLASASPGALGGMRGLVPLRMLLGNISMIVVPQQTAIGQASSKFNEHDELVDESAQQGITRTLTAMTRLHSVTT